jgi:hypothetical protein
LIGDDEAIAFVHRPMSVTRDTLMAIAGGRLK